MATQSVPPSALIDKPVSQRRAGRPQPPIAALLLDEVLDKLAGLDLDGLRLVEAAVDRLAAGQSLDGFDGFTLSPAA